MKRNRFDRRSFIKRSTAALAGASVFPQIVPGSALGLNGAVAPSERIALGLSGVGGRGGSLLVNFAVQKDVEIVAVCDVKAPRREWARQEVDRRRAAGGGAGGKSCETHVDFRELCARPDIDAVAIATPDFWHVLQAIEALGNGKDVYMEKPLGVSIEEGKRLRAAVHQSGRVFQFGTQERSSRNSRFGCEMVLNGRIGKLKHITVSTRRSVESEDYPPAPGGPPDWIDYDMWLGPAPWKPFCEQRVTNEWWFHTFDYSLGFISGCGVHTCDIAQWGNGTQLTGPVEIEGEGWFPSKGLTDCATDWDVNMRYANGVTLRFTGEKRMPLGVTFHGTDGWVFVKEEHLNGVVDAHPKSLLRLPIGPDERHEPFSNHHQRNFLDCVKSRAETVAPVDVAVRSDALCQLSEIAMKVGRKLKWDPDNEVFVGDAEANRLLSRPMRSPWRLR